MKRGKRLLWLGAAIPMCSWLFFAYVYYPRALERHLHGTYALVAVAEPSTTINPALVFGSIHNFARIRVELWRQNKRLRSEIVGAGDLPEDFLPLRVEWQNDRVLVTERSYHKTVSLLFSADK